MPDVHAILSPSASKRWMTCTPSARAESFCPDEGSVYAREGTVAHALAEALLRYYLDTDPLAVYDDPWAHLADFAAADGAFVSLSGQAEDLGADFREMLETVHDRYVRPVWEDFVKARTQDTGSQLLVEVQVDLSDWIPESFGTADAVIITGRTLRVYDLKYGRGVRVSATGNTQMRCYALGLLTGVALVYGIDTVVMTIAQPRLGAYDEDTLTSEELVSWGANELRPRAAIAYRGEGDYVPGDHCEFCRCKATCKALTEYVGRVTGIHSEPATFSPEEFAAVLPSLGVVELWAAAVRSKAVALLERGTELPGWKLVEGRSVRKIQDTETAEEILRQAGFTETDFRKAPELKGITDLERLVGKRNFNTLLGGCITRTVGRPTLAPSADPRPEYSPGVSAEADFNKFI